MTLLNFKVFGGKQPLKNMFFEKPFDTIRASMDSRVVAKFREKVDEKVIWYIYSRV